MQRKASSKDLRPQHAVPNWDDEGGALASGPQLGERGGSRAFSPDELEARLLALETLAVSILMGLSEAQLHRARMMLPANIPRLGAERDAERDLARKATGLALELVAVALQQREGPMKSAPYR